MLPPLPPELQAEVNNGSSSRESTQTPAFVSLYQHLKTNVLDYDASSLAKNKEQLATGVDERLRGYHVQLATDAIILRTLKELHLLNNKNQGPPPEVSELCYIISIYLSTIQKGLFTVDDRIQKLMSEEMSKFRSHLPTITAELSSYITNIETAISNMLEQSLPAPTPTTGATTPSTARTHPKQPTPSSTLSTHLTTLSTTISTLLTTQLSLLTTQIRHAELHTHSTLARHLTTHTTFLATVSQGLALKSRILALQREKEAYAEEGVRPALLARFEGLKREERGLVERETALRGLLAEFEAEGGGLGVFGMLGRRYCDVELEIGRVRMDVERLEGEVARRKKGVGLGR